MKKSTNAAGDSPARLIDDRIASLGDWRGQALASIADSKGLFNSSLDGKVRRALDIHEGDDLDEAAFKALFRAAVAFNKAAAK